MVIILGNEYGDLFKILEEAVYISPHTNAIYKGMNLTILPLAMGK